MKNQWMEYGLKNKAALQKNDIPTQMEFNRRYQQLMNLTQRSKVEEEKKKPIVEILVDPAKRNKTSSRLIDDLHSHDEPLFIKNANGEWEENRNRKSLNVTENYFNPQLDFDKEFTGWSKGMERGKTYSEKPIKRDPVSGTATFSTEEKFAPEQIMQIADNAIKGVKGNQEAFNFYQHKLETIADEDLAKLNKVFQSVYGSGAQYVQPDGKMINAANVIDSPEELAAAEAILQGQSMVKKGEELKPDKELANQRAQVNISLNKGSGASDTPINDLYGSIDNSLNNYLSKKGFWGKFSKRDSMPLSELNVDEQKMILDYAKDLTGLSGVKDGRATLDQESIKLKRGGNGEIDIYDAETDKRIGSLPRVGTNIKVQADVKGKKKVVEQGEKPKKKDDPLNLFD